MEKRNKILISALVVILAVLIAVIAWFYLRDKSTSQQPPVPKQNAKQQQPIVDKTQEVDTSNIKPIIKESQKQATDQSKIMAASRFFIERYGSFSSQADWQNLKDLKNSVTRQLWSDFEDLMAGSELDKDNYRSLSTKILSLRIVSQSEARATAEANTQKKEISIDGEKIFYQDVTVYLVKDGDEWLVARFE